MNFTVDSSSPVRGWRAVRSIAAGALRPLRDPDAVWNGDGDWDELQASTSAVTQLLHQPSLQDALELVLVKLQRHLGDEMPDHIDDRTLALSLDTTESRISELRRSLTNDLHHTVRQLRPVLVCLAGTDYADTVSEALDEATGEEELIAALARFPCALPLPAAELLAVARTSTTPAELREALALDYQAFNEALAALGRFRLGGGREQLDAELAALGVLPAAGALLGGLPLHRTVRVERRQPAPNPPCRQRMHPDLPHGSLTARGLRLGLEIRIARAHNAHAKGGPPSVPCRITRLQHSVVSTKSARERSRQMMTWAFSQHQTSTGVSTALLKYVEPCNSDSPLPARPARRKRLRSSPVAATRTPAIRTMVSHHIRP
nr:hypothetical protein OG781_07410 [Streptomyces sp. NBC_00830]